VLGPSLFGNLINLSFLELSDNIINEIDFSCFENLDNLETLKLDNVRLNVKVKPASRRTLPNLTYLQLKNAVFKLVNQFNFTNFVTLNLQTAELSSELIQSIPTRSIRNLNLRKSKLNYWAFDKVINRFGGSIIDLDLSDIALGKHFQSRTLNESFNLERLSLSNCDCVENVTLWNYDKLIFLDLSSNGISELRKRFLFNNKQIEWLNLSNNSLQVIRKTYFLGLTKLKSLDLSNNNIIDIKQAAFKYLTSINYLDMSNNQLKHLLQDAFETNYLILLRFISLRNNPQLSYMWSPIYSRSLYSIDNEGCNLPRIYLSYLIGNPVILTFNLRNNKFKEIKKTAFEQTKFILELLLSTNLIETVDKSAFDDLNELLVLDLSQNRLKALHNQTFSGLGQLKKLNLSFNSIEIISRSLLSGLEQLESLDLSFNSIKEVESSLSYF
jgi:Leucine-rich repeat (LRR) protein